jgi:hypothetical protein
MMPQDDLLDRHAEELSVERPLFEGPLYTFQIGEASGVGAPVYLGGDLHAVHAEGHDRPSGICRDPSLDGATITIDDHEHQAIKVTAVEGIWCLTLPKALYFSAPYFAVRDSENRLRIWLLLPPARALIGIAYLWLPRIPPPSSSPTG